MNTEVKQDKIKLFKVEVIDSMVEPVVVRHFSKNPTIALQL
jgi:hypothetical protein